MCITIIETRGLFQAGKRNGVRKSYRKKNKSEWATRGGGNFTGGSSNTNCPLGDNKSRSGKKREVGNRSAELAPTQPGVQKKPWVAFDKTTTRR